MAECDSEAALFWGDSNWQETPFPGTARPAKRPRIDVVGVEAQAGRKKEREKGDVMRVGLSRSLAALAGAALLLSTALSCASTKKAPDPAGDLRSGIGRIVADPVRATKMLASVDEIEAATGELGTLVTQERSSLVTLMRDYGSTRAAVDGSLEEFNSKRDALTRRLLAAHVSLKADATAPEWKKLKKLEMEMILSAATKSVGNAPAGKES
jgi:hypothetical protein